MPPTNETSPDTAPDPRATDDAGSPPGDGRDVNRQIGELTAAVRQIAQSQQTLLETVGRFGRSDAAPPADPAGDAGKALGSRDVRRVVADVLREREASRRGSDARDRYVRQKMADLPEAYRRQMPETDDEAALGDAERRVRKQFREDYKAAGGDSPEVTGQHAGGRRPGAAVDYSDLSPLQQIALGLKDAKPPEGARPGQGPLAAAARVPGAAAFSYGAD